MGFSVYVFAGPNDNRVFCERVREYGLRMYPILLQQPEITASDDPAAYPFCYLSPCPREDLHPYGDPLCIGSATDPLLDFMRPYFTPPALVVIGRLYCSNDVPALFAVTRPYFHRLAKWIRANWARLPTGQYIGPEAQALVEGGAKLAYFPPGVTIQRI